MFLYYLFNSIKLNSKFPILACNRHNYENNQCGKSETQLIKSFIIHNKLILDAFDAINL